MRRAIEFYNAELKDVLEPESNGKFIGIDPETGLYSVSDDPVVVFHDLRARGSTGLQALLRVGYDWTYDMIGMEILGFVPESEEPRGEAAEGVGRRVR